MFYSLLIEYIHTDKITKDLRALNKNERNAEKTNDKFIDSYKPVTKSKDNIFLYSMAWWVNLTRGISLCRALLLACSLALITHAKAQCLSPCFLNELLLWSNWRSLCVTDKRGVGPLSPFSLFFFSLHFLSPFFSHFSFPPATLITPLSLFSTTFV